MSKPRYKYCIVPLCKSTTIKTPQKVFFSVPFDKDSREKWCLAIGRVPGIHKTLSVKCSRYVCEDHFDLEQDMDNYMKWKMIGVGKLLLKKGVVPHKLQCQNETNNIKKSDKRQRVATRKLDKKTYNRSEILKINNKNEKLQEPDFYNIKRETKEASHHGLNLEIETEMIESMCVKEREEKVFKNEVEEEKNNYIFTVRYDSDTGGEYLISNNFRQKKG